MKAPGNHTQVCEFVGPSGERVKAVKTLGIGSAQRSDKLAYHVVFTNLETAQEFRNTVPGAGEVSQAELRSSYEDALRRADEEGGAR